MTYASILAVLTGAPDDAVTLSAAAQFVRGRSGEVRAVLALPTIPPLLFSDGMSGGYVSPEVIDLLHQGNDQARLHTEALVHATSQREGLDLHKNGGRIVLLPEQPNVEMVMLAETPLCDLVMVAQSTFRSMGIWSGLVSTALMQARVPFYVVRRVASETGVVTIAWDGSQAAGRAVRAAMPLLSSASKVVLFQDPDHINSTHRLAADLDRLSDYLKLHGVKNIHLVIQSGLSRGDGLGAAARQARADVLIAGAFSHARAMEALFGGTTEELLESKSEFNLLLAH